MGTRKKGSELVFTLQWRNKPNNKPDNADNYSNVIGMHDTPATTQDFETFKSYLLKNSGVAGNDVRVIYLTDSGPEWVIEDQAGFDIALCAFRLKARLGEVIYLKLDMIPRTRRGYRTISSDAETQIDEKVTIDGPPEWFLKYMVQFKKEIIEEVSQVVTGPPAAPQATTGLQENEIYEVLDAIIDVVENVPPAKPPVAHSSPKVHRHESKKHRRNIANYGDFPIEKELLKTWKYDRKLEVKLDKLDAKAKKIREKKQALNIRQLQIEEKEAVKKMAYTKPQNNAQMNGELVRPELPTGHFMGGEWYLHHWPVINSGQIPWTTNTQLRLCWGSAEMKAMTAVIKCPPLLPGEKTSLTVGFHIPENPGRYESFWNFYNEYGRFGRWLAVTVIVDPKEDPMNFVKKMKTEPAVEASPENLSPKHIGAKWLTALEVEFARKNTAPRQPVNTPQNIFEPEPDILPCTNKYGIDENELVVDLSNCKITDNKQEKEVKEEEAVEAKEQIVTQIVNVKEVGEDELEGAVMVKHEEVEGENQPDYINLDLNDLNTAQDNNNNINNESFTLDNITSSASISEAGSDASSDISSGYDVINSPECDEKEETGYVYITIDGNKLSVPKHILLPEFVATAEQAPAPDSLIPEPDTTFEPKSQTLDESRGEVLELQSPPQPEPETQEAAASESSSSELFREINREAAKLQEELFNLEHNVQESASFPTSGASGNQNLSRLFVFPENHPGFESYYDGTFTPKSYAKIHALQKYFDMCEGGCADPSSIHPCKGDLDRLSERTSTAVPSAPQEPKAPASTAPSSSSSSSSSTSSRAAPTAPPKPSPVHILPENLVSGAVNLASSAINTARSVISLMVPEGASNQPGRWINGHFVLDDPCSLRAKNLILLDNMGFVNGDLNATLLARYEDDLSRVVSELVS